MACLPANKLEELKSLLNPSSPERFLPNIFWKLTLPPGEVVGSIFFSLKWEQKDELKGTQSDFTP